MNDMIFMTLNGDLIYIYIFFLNMIFPGESVDWKMTIWGFLTNDLDDLGVPSWGPPFSEISI